MKSLNYHFVDKCSATTVMDIAQLFGAKEHSHVNVSTLREVGEIEWSEVREVAMLQEPIFSWMEIEMPIDGVWWWKLWETTTQHQMHPVDHACKWNSTSIVLEKKLWEERTTLRWVHPIHYASPSQPLPKRKYNLYGTSQTEGQGSFSLPFASLFNFCPSEALFYELIEAKTL